MDDIQGYTDSEWKKVRAVIAPVLHLPAGPRLIKTSILLLEKAAYDNPKEWLYWYTLGDYYQRLDAWSSSIHACKQCYKLRPDDHRTAYALATAYRFYAQTQPDLDSVSRTAIAKAALLLFIQVLNALEKPAQRRFVARHIKTMTTQYPELAALIESPTPRIQSPSLARRLFNLYRLGRLLSARLRTILDILQ